MVPKTGQELDFEKYSHGSVAIPLTDSSKKFKMLGFT